MNVVLAIFIGFFVVFEAIQLGLVIARALLFGVNDALAHVEFDLTAIVMVAFLVFMAVQE